MGEGKEAAAAVLLQLISTGAMPASLLPSACEHLSSAATGSAPTSPADPNAEQVMAICAYVYSETSRLSVQMQYWTRSKYFLLKIGENGDVDTACLAAGCNVSV